MRYQGDDVTNIAYAYLHNLYSSYFFSDSSEYL